MPSGNLTAPERRSSTFEERREAMSVFKIEGSPFYQYDFIFKSRRYRGSTKQSNKTAAQRHESNLRQKLADSRSGILETEPPPSFAEFAKEFLERTKNEMKPSTARGYKNSLQNVKPWFGAKRLDEISTDEIERYKHSRMEKKRSPSTVNRELAFLRRVLLYAVKISRPSAGQQPLKWTLLTTPFVAHGVEFLKENRRERIINFDEERRYLAAARQPLHDVAILILEMGLRPGEVCPIRRQDVHLYGSPYVHVPAGKSQNARRDVPITDRAKKVLKARLTAAEGECIFPSRIGTGHDWTTPMNELDPAHRSALRESKVTPAFRIYDLRHTYGTRAIEGGTDPLTLMRLMGHGELSTTLRYVHLSKRHLTDAQVKIERYRAEREIAEAEEMKTARNESTAVQ
jgi:integrase